MKIYSFFLLLALTSSAHTFCGRNTRAVNWSNYKSQFGQDKLVNDNFFHNAREGVFVDIGAHDGTTYSNSYFFEKELGWKGLCVEPMPDTFAQLRNNRDCICVQGAIANEKCTKKFLLVQTDRTDTEMLSGLVDKYDPKHIERINNELDVHGGTKKEIFVQCYPINDLLEQHGITYVDFLSVDTEGGELDIIKSIDFDHVFIDVITVENNYKDNSIKKFLTQKGYIFIRQVGCDEVYKKITYP